MPLAQALHPAHPLAPDISSDHRTERVPPIPRSQVTNIDPARSQQVFGVRQAKVKAMCIIATNRMISGQEVK